MDIPPDDSFFIKQDRPLRGWLALWHKMTTPSVQKLEAEVYYPIRLLLTLLVISSLVNSVQLIAAIGLSGKSYALVAATALGANLLAYAAARRGHYHLTARGVIVFSFLLTLLAAFLNTDPVMLLGLLIPLLLTSFFLSQRAILGVGAAALVAIFLFGSVLKDFSAFAGLFFLVLLVTLLLKANAHYQHKLHHVQQARLAFSESYYRTLVESALEGIWVIDPEGKTTYANQSMADMLGYSVEEMIGSHFSKFFPEDFRQQGELALLQRKQGEKVVNVDRRLLHRNGSEVWALVSAQPLYDEQGGVASVLGMVSDITRRKKAEDALRQNEERFRTLVDSMAEGMVVLDENGIISMCNTSAERILGLTAKQIIGISLLDESWRAVHKDGTPFFADEFPGVITFRTREPQSAVTLGFYRPDSSLVWLSINSRPLQPGGVVISFSDITYQMGIQERLRQRNEELVSVQAIAAAIAASLDPDSVLKMLARQAADLLKAEGCVIYELREGEARAVAGYGPENWVEDELRNPEAHPLAPLLNPLSRPRQILAEQTTEHLTYVLKYGIESMLLVPLHYQGQQLGSAVLIDKHAERRFSGWDISLIQMLMHHAAIAIHNARLFKQLGESEERYRSLIELSQDAIMVEFNFRIVYANPAALKMFGVGSLEEMQQHIALDIAHREEWKRITELGLKVYKYRERIPLQEFTLVRQDGSTFYAEVGAVLINYRGQPALLAVARDITERKRAEQDRLDASIQKERVRLLETFISDTSHDLKTPLAVMKLKAYLLEKTTDPEKMRGYLRELIGQIDRMERLITALHTMARLDTAPNFIMQPIDLNQLVTHLTDQMRSIARERQIDLQLELAPTLPPLTADLEQIHRALENIIENAIHYTPSQGNIRLRTYMQDSKVCCEIIDTGIGIPADQQEKIFERFYRVDQARSTHTGGTGLGLAIARKIIEGHGGQIEVSSELGTGSTFRVVLPVNRLDQTGV